MIWKKFKTYEEAKEFFKKISEYRYDDDLYCEKAIWKEITIDDDGEREEGEVTLDICIKKESLNYEECKALKEIIKNINLF